MCLFHDPSHEKEAAEARRLGGLRRRRELTLAGAYEVEGLDTLDGVRRLISIAGYDALGLESSVARVRLLLATAAVALKVVETVDLTARVAALEQALDPNVAEADRMFDLDASDAQYAFLPEDPLPPAGAAPR